jgi:polyhydroxyalkanoate synthase
MSNAAPSGDEFGDRVRTAVDRTIARSIKGLDFMLSDPPAVGQTPKDLVYERGTLRLYHYHPQADEVYRVPVLLVMATTNRGYVFDLAPGQSMVEYLLRDGFDVFVIDWEPPAPEERGLGLAHYTLDFIPTCIRQVRERTGEPDVSLIGYCMGGVLSLIYAGAHPEGPLKNLVCLTTPVNWHEMGLLRRWCDPRYFDLDRLVDTLGVVPTDFILGGFELLRPAGRTAGRIRAWDNMWNDAYVRSYRAFDRWSNETLPLAGEYFRETTRDLMWDNRLYHGNLRVGGREIDLGNIRVPVLHAIAEHDHIVPYAASKPLLELVGSDDTREVVLKGGHVSLIAGPNAAKRMWPAASQWLAERST